MPRPSRSSPSERTSSWPDTPSDDPSGEVARLLTLNLQAAMGDLSMRAAGARTGVDHSTIQGILQGRTWPDLDTIAKLERGLGAALWPGASQSRR
ncbi:helix-turn-helix domain-containing protein [Salinibacterium sp. GXW1014]|uniref:helix-turn-helix domain-containing protein n=1 Tax=Salinibacterium sp. GXW1014 TaxID=3377838 RepID=UPI00383BDAC0